LRRLFHPVEEHRLEVVALRCQYGLVGVDRLLFNNKNHVGKSLVIYQGTHVSYQAINCLVVDLVLFKAADVQDTDVVEPLASIKTSEDKELLCAYHAGCMSLSTGWSFFKF
jgi:hypothetical protein